jgi:hypothetical protein
MISLQRIEGWEQRLFDFTRASMSTPYAWGTNDCIIFAAGCVEAITGTDLAKEHRGTYTDENGAARIIARAGAGSLGEFVGLYLPEKPLSLVQRGDIVIAEGPDGDFAAVCQGATCVGPSRRGLVHVKILQAKQAFKV